MSTVRPNQTKKTMDDNITENGIINLGHEVVGLTHLCAGSILFVSHELRIQSPV